MGRLFKPVREELERKYFAKLEWTSMVKGSDLNYTDLLMDMLYVFLL